MQLRASMLSDVTGCMALGAKRGVSSTYKMEQSAKMGEKRSMDSPVAWRISSGEWQAALMTGSRPTRA